MRLVRRKGFTLVELLVVIGIIAVLIGILLPALGRARQASWSIKCASNLRSIGQGLVNYTTENKGFFPAAYIYSGMSILNNQQQPTVADHGYLHWSSFLYSRTDKQGDDSPYRSFTGWDMFQCPTFERGGLPPTNTFDANHDSSDQHSDDAGVIDFQATRCAFTVNEALCPRNKFCLNMPDTRRTYKYVSLGSVKQSANTILATEFNQDWHVVADAPRSDSSTGGGERTVPKSHRPVSGYVGIGGEVNLEKIAPDPFGNRPTIRRVTVNDLMNDPNGSNITASKTRLDWVGRNHNPGKDQNGFNTGKSNFLYVDSHVETKGIRETLAPSFQWGENMYSLTRTSDVYTH